MSQFSATRDFGVKRPTIPSLASAQAEFNNWLKENTFGDLSDLNGLPWSVHVRLKQGPGPQCSKSPLYQLEVTMTCLLSVEALVKARILSEDVDGRLIGFLKDKPAPKMRYILGQKEDLTLNGIINKFSELMSQIKSKWPSTDFSLQQKKCVGQWIDRKLQFGTRV